MEINLSFILCLYFSCLINTYMISHNRFPNGLLLLVVAFLINRVHIILREISGSKIALLLLIASSALAMDLVITSRQLVKIIMRKIKETHKVKEISPGPRKPYSGMPWAHHTNYYSVWKYEIQDSYVIHKGITQCTLFCLFLLNSGHLRLISPGTPNDRAITTENETLRYNSESVRVMPVTGFQCHAIQNISK